MNDSTTTTTTSTTTTTTQSQSLVPQLGHNPNSTITDPSWDITYNDYLQCRHYFDQLHQLYDQAPHQFVQRYGLAYLHHLQEQIVQQERWLIQNHPQSNMYPNQKYLSSSSSTHYHHPSTSTTFSAPVDVVDNNLNVSPDLVSFLRVDHHNSFLSPWSTWNGNQEPSSSSGNVNSSTGFNSQSVFMNLQPGSFFKHEVLDMKPQPPPKS